MRGRRGQYTGEFAILIGTAALAAIAMQLIVRRSIQAGVGRASDVFLGIPAKEEPESSTPLLLAFPCDPIVEALNVVSTNPSTNTSATSNGPSQQGKKTALCVTASGATDEIGSPSAQSPMRRTATLSGITGHSVNQEVRLQAVPVLGVAPTQPQDLSGVGLGGRLSSAVQGTVAAVNRANSVASSASSASSTSAGSASAPPSNQKGQGKGKARDDATSPDDDATPHLHDGTPIVGESTPTLTVRAVGLQTAVRSDNRLERLTDEITATTQAVRRVEEIVRETSDGSLVEAPRETAQETTPRPRGAAAHRPEDPSSRQAPSVRLLGSRTSNAADGSAGNDDRALVPASPTLAARANSPQNSGGSESRLEALTKEITATTQAVRRVETVIGAGRDEALPSQVGTAPIPPPRLADDRTPVPAVPSRTAAAAPSPTDAGATSPIATRPEQPVSTPTTPALVAAPTTPKTSGGTEVRLQGLAKEITSTAQAVQRVEGAIGSVPEALDGSGLKALGSGQLPTASRPEPSANGVQSLGGVGTRSTPTRAAMSVDRETAPVGTESRLGHHAAEGIAATTPSGRPVETAATSGREGALPNQSGTPQRDAGAEKRLEAITKEIEAIEQAVDRVEDVVGEVPDDEPSPTK